MKNIILATLLMLSAHAFGQTTVSILCSSAGCGTTTLQSNAIQASGTGAGGVSLTAGTGPLSIPTNAITILAPQATGTTPFEVVLPTTLPTSGPNFPAGFWLATQATPATATATETSGVVNNPLTLTGNGANYATAPVCIISDSLGGIGTGATCSATYSATNQWVSGITWLSGGSNYSHPVVSFSPQVVLTISGIEGTASNNVQLTGQSGATTTNDLVWYTDASGDIADSGIASSNLALVGSSNIFSGSNTFGAISASGQITSTVASGTAPFVVSSSTQVSNLNASELIGGTWASPGAIGGTTPSSAAFTTITGTSSITLGTNSGTVGSVILEGSTSGAATLTTNGIATTIGASAQVEVPDNKGFIISQSGSSTGSSAVQYGAIGTGTTEAADVTGGNSTGLINTGNKCTFALTTSTFTLALSPVSICSFTLPSAANTWTWQCSMEWSNNAGTSPTFAIGVTWAHAPSAAFQMETIYTLNASAPAKQVSTTTTTNAAIGATGALTTSSTLYQAFASGNFTASATSGTFSPTVILTGTGATGTATGQCMLL